MDPLRVGGIFGAVFLRHRCPDRHRLDAGFVVDGAFAGIVEPLSAGLKQDRIVLDHGPLRRVHRELEPLAHELVAILDGHPLGNFAELIPVLRPVLLDVETDLLELLGVEIVAVTIEPHRIAVDLAVLGGAIDERLGKIAGKCVVGAIAELLDIEGRQQTLVEPYRHEPVLADEPIRRSTGGKSDADLLAEIPERKPLEVDLDVRILHHEHLDALVDPGPLLRIVEGPETDVDGLLGLGKGAPGNRHGDRRPKTGDPDAANHVATTGNSKCRFLHCFLPNLQPDLSPEPVIPSLFRFSFACRCPCANRCL